MRILTSTFIFTRKQGTNKVPFINLRRPTNGEIRGTSWPKIKFVRKVFRTFLTFINLTNLVLRKITVSINTNRTMPLLHSWKN